MAWADGDEACVRLAVVGDTPGDTAELADGLAEWAAEDGVGDSSAEPDGGPVTLERCA